MLRSEKHSPSDAIDAIFGDVTFVHFGRIVGRPLAGGRMVLMVGFDHSVRYLAKLIFSHAGRFDQIELQVFGQFATQQTRRGSNEKSIQ